MEDWQRTLLVVGTGVCLFGLAVAILFCAGLSDVVHWNSCSDLLAFAARTEGAAVEGLSRLWAEVAGR